MAQGMDKQTFTPLSPVEIQTRLVVVKICCHLVTVLWLAWQELLISELWKYLCHAYEKLSREQNIFFYGIFQW